MRKPARGLALGLGLAVGLNLAATLAHAESVTLFAAGSLKAALGEVADAYEKASGVRVERQFGPSGLMRKRIEQGEPAQVFASANMKHPLALREQGRGGPVALFARNKLCAMAQPGITVDSGSLLDVMLAESTRLGTSTPKADPAGDYAWQVFEKAERLRAGSFTHLSGKALQLTGGPDSAKPPAGRNTYGWVMSERQADVFLSYCTNAVLAKAEVPDLQIIALPASLSVGADYGLMVLDRDSADAWALAMFILAPEGQRILARYGFDAEGIPGP